MSRHLLVAACVVLFFSASTFAGLAEDCDRNPDSCSPEDNHFHFNIKEGYCLGGEKGQLSEFLIEFQSK
jgi:hypothetical protein